jgi:chromosome segregation ATPase
MRHKLTELEKLKELRQEMLKRQADLEKALIFHKNKVDVLTAQKNNLEQQGAKLQFGQKQKFREVSNKQVEKQKMEELLRKAKEVFDRAVKDCNDAKTNYDKLEAAFKNNPNPNTQKLWQAAQTAYLNAKAAQNNAENNYNATKRDLEKVNTQLAGLQKDCQRIADELKKNQDVLTSVDNDLFHHDFEYRNIRDITLPSVKRDLSDLNQEIAAKVEQEKEPAHKEQKEEEVRRQQAEVVARLRHAEEMARQQQMAEQARQREAEEAARQQQYAAQNAQNEIQKAQLMQQNSELELEITALRQMIASAQQEIARIQGELKQAGAEEMRAQEELQRIEQQKKAEEQKLQSKESEKQQLETEIKTKEEKVKQLKNKHQELVTAFQQATNHANEIDKKVKVLEEKQRNCKSIIAQKEKELSQARSELQSLHDQARDFVCPNHTLREMANGTCGNLNQLGPQRVDAARRLVQKMIEVEDKIKNIESVLGQKRSELQGIESQLSSTRQELKSAKEKARRAEDDQKRNESEAQIAEKDLSYSRSKMSSIDAEISTIRQKISTPSYQESQTRFRKQSAEKKKEYLNQQLTEKNSEFQSLNKALEEASLKQIAIRDFIQELSVGGGYNQFR